jgi:hypothetical protein
MYISITEYAVNQSPDALHGWKFVRFEYWEQDQPYANTESHVWLPPHIDLDRLEILLNAPDIRKRGRWKNLIAEIARSISRARNYVKKQDIT